MVIETCIPNNFPAGAETDDGEILGIVIKFIPPFKL